jgi:Flp pilus assembly secretin CpaC
MVAELFEKLKASETRGAAARAQLAQMQHELSALRATKAEPASAETGDMVMLEIRFLELDLDGIAKAQIDLPGSSAKELGESGLFALAARGALDCCHANVAAQGPAAKACDCVTCSTGTVEAQGPAVHQTAACNGQSRDAAADTNRVKELLAELVEAGLVETLSRPQAMARSGQSARICIGQEIPFKQTMVNEKGTPVESVSYCSAGIEFDLKPQVLADGKVQIELRAERSDVDQGGLWRNGAPTITRQSIETSLEIPAGKTAVAAGLIFERPVAVKSRYSTPGGAQVQFPYGAVQYAPYRAGEATPAPYAAAEDGGHPAKTHQRRELVILVTPKVVASVARAADEVAGQ